MSDGGWQAEVILDIQNLRIRECLRQVQARLTAGEDPLTVVRVCELGLKRVGELYAQGNYFLAGLIMGGEIFREVTELVLPYLKQSDSQHGGRVLIGTVRGDIHDMGKNLVKALLQCHGVDVQDLGVDVHPDEFVRQTRITRPDIVALSGLLTTSYDPMREVVRIVRSSLPPEESPKAIIIGGGLINEEVGRYVGADLWTNDAVHGVRLCQQILHPDGS